MEFSGINSMVDTAKESIPQWILAALAKESIPRSILIPIPNGIGQYYGGVGIIMLRR